MNLLLLKAIKRGRISKQKSGETRTDVLAAARQYFGFEDLRPGQAVPIESLLAKRDTLVVMPTGSGKSAIYQIAGMMKPGCVLVVSPLIALQKDQVDSIHASEGGADAIVINSGLKASEFRENLERVAEGGCKFIFLAPEQLRKEETRAALSKAKIRLVAVDEAHCISEWGHDFRPDYLELGRVIEEMGHPVTIAMTATASEPVRKEIVERLRMKKPRIFVGGFDRPNIHLRVDRFDAEEKKLEAVVHQVRWADKPGIVYVATRKAAEEIMRGLEQEGMRALFYHGGLKAAERTQIQDDFMAGEAEVIVATNAFGMGIDKADIRFVYHYDAPDSLDSYYQEIGRAGRDGERAQAILFFREQDIGAQAFHTAGGGGMRDLDQIAEAIAEAEEPVTREEIAEEVDASTRGLTAAIQKLEDAGAVEVLATGEVQLSKDADLEQAAQVAAEQEETRQETNRHRLEQMRAYADTVACRREHLLRYFGDDFTAPCNNCDNCEAAHPENEVDASLGTRREVV